ncbi:hypothetical protein PR048_024029 [Dryococelus australis]|uniref:Uncharacterized protein n=1 Tax=Dryococelus australis TaxID=614101 RepID=A0ABQ9GVQ1_9NEOP|nr:hypothetical protein PR048_024029 [Dryococelus australis]
MVSSDTDTNRSGVLVVVDIGDSFLICLKDQCLPANQGQSVSELPNSDWPSQVRREDTWPITKAKLHQLSHVNGRCATSANTQYVVHCLREARVTQQTCLKATRQSATLVTYPPADSPALGGRSDARPVRGTSRSQSDSGCKRIKGTATSFRLCVLSTLCRNPEGRSGSTAEARSWGGQGVVPRTTTRRDPAQPRMLCVVSGRPWRDLSCPTALPATGCPPDFAGHSGRNTRGIKKMDGCQRTESLARQTSPGAGIKGRGNGSSPRRPANQRHRPAPFPTCENPGVNRPGIEPGSTWRGASRLTAQPTRPLTTREKYEQNNDSTEKQSSRQFTGSRLEDFYRRRSDSVNKALSMARTLHASAQWRWRGLMRVAVSPLSPSALRRSFERRIQLQEWARPDVF